MINPNKIKELLRLKTNGHVHHREGQTLEFKESFNFAGLEDYFRDFAAFANNKGGYLIFGVSDSPRKLNGISKKSKEQFEKIDPEKISEYLHNIFSISIEWEQALIPYRKKSFGVFKISVSGTKPIIAKKNEGKDQVIKNGEIYYRYGGRTQKIRYPELETIINKRIDDQNKNWIDLMSKIAKAGPQNAAILDTEKSLISKGEKRILVLDEALASKLKFIKEGQFSEKKGATTLKLVGDITTVDKVEVVKKVKEDLIKRYPLTATEVAKRVKDKCQECSTNIVWEIISDNDIKNNFDYSAYNFRNKKQQDEYVSTGKAPSAPSIYNESAVEFIVNIFKDEYE